MPDDAMDASQVDGTIGPEGTPPHELGAEDVLPEDAGIAEILRWAMSHRVRLQYPPWEDAFCGSDHPCVYAGMVQGDGVRGENIRSMVRQHAEWLVGQMALMTLAEGGMPSITEYPAKTFYIAVCDATVHEEPRIHMFVYDRAETVRRSRPYVDPFDADEVQRRHGYRNSPLFGIRPLALEGFLTEMGNLIRDYLITEDAERERALAEIAETHPEVMQNGDTVESADAEQFPGADADG